MLIAGGGTGSSACYMGEELRHTNAQVSLFPLVMMIQPQLLQIVYLDFSPASLAIAQQRADIRQLDNVQFLLGSIEQIPHLGLGTKYTFPWLILFILDVIRTL